MIQMTAAAPASDVDPGGSLFDPGRNCYVATRAARASVLVGAESYYRAFAQAAERATHSIIIVGCDFDSRTRLGSNPERPGTPLVLGEFLNSLARRRRGLHIHILAWDYAASGAGSDRPERPLYGVGWTPHRRIHLHYDSTGPAAGTHHQKLVVVDDAVAFSGGLDLTCRRGEAHADRPPRMRRTMDVELPSVDTMAAVDGEAAQVLAQLVRQRWMVATGEAIPPAAGAGDPWPPCIEPEFRHVDVAISRTVPSFDAGQGIHEVEAMYLDTIAGARDYIYIENPYFTSDSVAAALAARLESPNPPEIVLVTRHETGGWLDPENMAARRSRLVARLREADAGKRFEAYHAQRHSPDQSACPDCHIKVLIADDDWLRVGSANLSNRSMRLDTECDLTFEARGKARSRQAICDLRDRLLAAHLCTSAERVREVAERAGSLHAAIKELQSDRCALSVLAADAPPEPADTTPGAPEPLVSLDSLIAYFSPDTESHKSGPAWGKIACIALAVLALTLTWRYTPLAEVVTPERVIEWARAVGNVWWAPLVVIAAYSPAAFVMFPRPLITLFAVIAFGPWLGFATSMTGIVGAALATYYAGRVLPRDTVRHLAGEKLNQMSEVLRRRGLIAVFAVRIVPVAPFFIEGMVAGAVRIKVWHYVVGTVLGMAPGTLTTTVFGDQLATALEDPSRINYWLVGAVALFFVVLIWYVRRWFVKEHRAAGGEPGPAARAQA